VPLYLFIILLLGIGVLFCFPCVGEVLDEAVWIRDPIFRNIPVIDYFKKGKDELPNSTGPQNVHTYFRKEFVLSKKPVRAKLHVTADDYVRFYVNGAYVFQGPAPAYPFAHPFYTLDITSELLTGTNCLAAHVYYQGLRNRVWNSADNRSGLIALLDIAFEDGTNQRIVTDESWKCRRSTAYFSSRTTGYQTQFLEDIDMREIPIGWRSPGFDDSSWLNPLVDRQDHVFVRSVTPPLQVLRATPTVIKEIAPGNYLFDFGTELVGSTRVKVLGPAGHIIEIRHAEELNADGTARYSLRAKCEYREQVILSGEEDLVEFYDYKGFRYVEVLNSPEMPGVWVEVRHHPFHSDSSFFASSDEKLTAIWELCKNGVRFGAQGVFIDCPTREKGPYLGDAFITSRSHLILTGDPCLTQKTLQDFRYSQRICPGMMAVAPGSFHQEIAEYSLLWPLMLANYYRYTGDRYFVQKMAADGFPELFGYFKNYESADGLLSGLTEKWVLVDWPANLRDDYDYEYAKTRENTVLNAYYYASLSTAGKLCKEFNLELQAQEYLSKAEQVRNVFNRKNYDPEKRLYIDAPGSSHASLHANALPLAFGMVPEDKRSHILDFIRQKRLSCGPLIAPFVIEACYEHGAAGLGFDLLTSTDEHSWVEMLRSGATTCMEVWGPEQKWNTSWCHPWSSSPIFLIAERLVGITPHEPGWKSIKFSPHVPQNLTAFSLKMPFPFGFISVNYDSTNGFILRVPPGFPVVTEPSLSIPVLIQEELQQAVRTLTEWEADLLKKYGWQERVGTKLAVWVSVEEQKLRLINDQWVLWETPCSTAAAGTGNRLNSNQTPIGWHSVCSKAGEGEPWGRVFRAGKPTCEVWQPGQSVVEDLVLTRVLFLTGEESGKNKGGDVDTYRRQIYIHGTNGEELIGTPASHGCIRLRNSDAITAYSRIPTGTLVLITPDLPDSSAH